MSVRAGDAVEWATNRVRVGGVECIQANAGVNVITGLMSAIR